MVSLKNLSTVAKVFFLFAVGGLALGLINFRNSSTAQSSQSKRQLDNRVPGHLPIKIKIKKDKEEGFQDLKNEHWAKDFVLEVKNTGDRPIYALSLVWELTEVKMPDGSPYGSTFRYGRGEFITVPGERPKPEDDPIQPGETYVFKLSTSSINGWERWASDHHLSPPKSVMVWFNFLSFGDDTGWQGPEGRTFERKKPVAFYPPNKGDPFDCKEQARDPEPWLRTGFSIVPASLRSANFLFGDSPSKTSPPVPDICCPGTFLFKN